MDENGVKLVCFEICGEKFAFNTDYLVEIVQVQHTDITPFFSPIPMIREKWNYRGTLVYIIDIRDVFGLEDSLGKTEYSVLVVKIQERIFGLLTDAVLQVRPLAVFYEYPNMISTLPRRYFAGVTIIDAELVLLLAIEEFIKDYELDALLSRIGESDSLTHPFTD
jgi:chemotaxis signal transduction protein